jgi:trans-aconitate 2-methyltransferase
MSPSPTSWSPTQYSAFERERTRPVLDLLAAIPGRGAETAIDLGCGPGNSTEALAGHFPGADIVGLDSSAPMIAAARKRLPHLAFEETDIERWDAAGPYDVILANASLQWVPDHAALFPRLASKLAQGGSLAMQMPDNLDEPTHRLMREVAAGGPWAARLADVDRRARWDARWYYDLLRPQCSTIDVWRTIYYHPLAGVDAIVEWVKGTGLRPYLAPLDDTERADYLARYRTALEAAYPLSKDGRALLPFPRLFIVATR